MATAAEKIVLGSGKIYVVEYTADTIPEDATIEDEENLLGLVKNGASLAYTPEFYTAKDDLGLASKTIITNEEVVLSCGIMTWNGNTLTKLSSTAEVSEASGKRTVKIGGVGRQNGKQYVIRFLHEDARDGDIRVTIVGNNQSGFTLSFAKDAETVIDAQFTAVPHDSDGTLVIYEEEIPSV